MLAPADRRHSGNGPQKCQEKSRAKVKSRETCEANNVTFWRRVSPDRPVWNQLLFFPLVTHMTLESLHFANNFQQQLHTKGAMIVQQFQ